MGKLTAIALGVLIILSAVPSSAVPPVHLWSQSFGGTGSDRGFAIDVDASGNVYITGEFGGTVDFGGGDLVSAGDSDIFIAKYNSSGVHQWSKRFGDTVSDRGWGIGVDGSGDVLLAGFFGGTVDFGGGSLVASGTSDIFVAKFSAGGAHQWSKRFGDSGVGNTAFGLAVDGSGSAVITGSLRGAVNFGGGDLTSAGQDDIYVAKFDGSGVYQWSQRFGGTGSDTGFGVATDGSGNVVITGYYHNVVDFGGGNLVSAGGLELFIAKFDASGVHQWSQRFGSGGGDVGYAIATDASGNVLMTGYFHNTVDFGGGGLASSGSFDIVVAKYDASGVHQWSQSYGGSGGDQGLAIVADGAGNVYVTGGFAGSVSLGGGSLGGAGGGEVFLARYDAAGAHEWSLGFGGTGGDSGRAVAVDGSGNTFLTGSFMGSVNFGGLDIGGAGSNDVVLAKYSEGGTVPVLISWFDAVPRQRGIELAWEYSADEALDGFTLYRGRDDSAPTMIATGDAHARSYTDAAVEPGVRYNYELVIRTAGGDEFRAPLATAMMPSAATTLAQNYPNPFNPQTTIKYAVSATTSVSIDIFDASGALVRRLNQGVRAAGNYSAEWDGRDAFNRPVSSGVYFYRLSGLKGSETKKMVLIK